MSSLRKYIPLILFLLIPIVFLLYIFLSNPDSSSDIDVSSEPRAKALRFVTNLGLKPRGYPPSFSPDPFRIALGRYLFYDKRLSKEKTHSCGTCHQPQRAFTDGLAQAIGSTGQRHPRNTMTLTNVAFRERLTWGNPLLHSLEGQALIPMFGEFPIEMNMVGLRKELLQRIHNVPLYRAMFAKAFPGQKPVVSLAHLVKALAAFERTLLSMNSPYDRFQRGDKDALPKPAQRGLKLFYTKRLSCFRCHGGKNFDTTVDNRGRKEGGKFFHNTNLYNVDDKGGYPRGNTGVYGITWKKKDMGHFKTPTLRNVGLTPPYMHDGSLATLKQVIRHYAAGGQAQLANPQTKRSPYTSHLVKGFALTQEEEKALLAFLHSLTDRSFVTNPKFQDPWLDKN